MLTVAVLWLLAVPAVVAALGALALWRGRRGVMRVSSTRLWAGLESAASGTKKRALDPVWLLVVMAATLAGLALPGVQWQQHANDLPSADVLVTVRSAATTQAFVRVREVRHVREPVQVVADGRLIGTPTLEELARGVTVDVPAATDKLQLELRTADAALATRQFVREVTPPFGVLTVGRPNAALLRAFRVHASARLDDATVRPIVLLADEASFALDPEERDVLVITCGRATPAGVDRRAPTTQPKPNSPKLTSTALLNADALANVRIAAATPLKADGSWRVLAETSVGPWLLHQRDASRNVTRVHFASVPGAETDWPAYPSFVIFCARLLEEVNPPRHGDAIGWRDVTPPTVATPVAPAHALTPYFVVGAIACAVVAVLALLGRSRTVQDSGRS